MRKVNPKDVRDAFLKEVDELIAYFDRVSGALQGTSREQGDISELAETVFLTACVAFERFLSDLFLAYMNRDFSAYQRDLRGRIEDSVRSKFGTWAKPRIAFEAAQHVRVSELERIVDDTGRNVAFADAADLKDKAARWLYAPHKYRVLSLSVDDEHLFDTARRFETSSPIRAVRRRTPWMTT